MKRYQHLFFDLDRTLWDFESNSRQALSEIYETCELQGVGIAEIQQFIAAYEIINEELWSAYRLGNIHKRALRKMRFHKTLEKFGCADTLLSKRMEDMYISISPIKTALFPNAIEVLEYLADKYRMHIITNGFEEVQHIKLENSRLRHYFDFVMTSELAAARKPDPTIFRLAMQKVGAVPSNSLMIGDDLIADIGGARSIRMDQVFFNPGKNQHQEEVTHEIVDLIELKNFL